jgi:hypothetical protein
VSLPIKGVLHVLALDIDEHEGERFEDVVMRYELADLEDLLTCHARFADYLAERDQA